MLKPEAPRASTITVKVFNVENRGYVMRRFHSDPGKRFTEKSVDQILEAIADDLDKRFPTEKYQLVQVGPFRFNLVWRGKREPPGSLPAAGW